MTRALRIAGGLFLALVIVTCTDRNLNGPRAPGRMGLNLSAFRSSSRPGQPPIPVDSVTVSLHSLDGGADYDTAYGFGGLPNTDDALTVSLVIPLKHPTETFAMNVTVKGKGYTWYVASDTVTIGAGTNLPPLLVVKLVGPGTNAGSLFIGPQDTTVTPGLPVSLYASVSDSFEGTLTGVPVGFRLQNPALGTIAYPTYLTPVLVPVNAGTRVDTTWLIGETPNHTLDSTQIYIVPRTGGGAPSRIFLASGDAQVDTPMATLPLPLTTLVTDSNGIPVGLARVAWARTGFGTFVSANDTTVADSFGFARMTYKLGAFIHVDTITASLVGTFAGPPPSVTFTATADTGLTLSFDTATYLLGKSQVSYSIFVNTRIPVSSNLTVQIGRSDSAAPAASQKFGLLNTSVVIPAGGTFGCCLQLTGNNLGSANLIAHAAGYQSGSANVIVTTPMLVVDSTLTTFNGLASLPTLVYAADSTGAGHYSSTDLVIHDSSSDPTVALPDSTTVTIPAGNFYALAPIAGLKPGTATITFLAANYPPAVTQVTVDTAFLYVYAGAPYGAGLGLTTTDNYIYMPGPVRSTTVFNLVSSDPTVFTVPATVTLFADSTFSYFPITGTGLGQATLTVRGPGILVSDSVQPLTVSTPVVQPVVVSTVSRGVKTQVYVYTEDTLGVRSGNVTAPLTVNLSTTDPNAIWDSTHITIKTGTDLDSVGVIFNSTGLFQVTATATGYSTGSTSTNSAAPPVGVRAAPTGLRRVQAAPMYPDSLRRVKPRTLKRPPRPRR